MRKQLLLVLILTALVAAACGSAGNGDAGLQSSAAESAAADVEGVDGGCEPIFELNDNFEDQDATVELVESLATNAEEAAILVADESEATARFFELYKEVWQVGLEAIKEDPEISDDDLFGVMLPELLSREEEITSLRPETLAYIERRCGLRFGERFETGGTSEEVATEPGESMDGGDAGDGDDGTDTDSATGPDATVDEDDKEPLVKIFDVESTSVGATGRYWSVNITVDDILRTNKEPRSYLAGGSTLTPESWVLVEIRLANEDGGTTTIPSTAFRWLDAQGNLTDPVEVLTKEGEDWNISLETGSSAKGFVVFPASVGVTEGASLQIVGTGTEPETIPLGLADTASPYPVALDDGDTGSAFVQATASCGYTVSTEVRGATAGLNAVTLNRWERAGTGRRFVVIDLAVTVVEEQTSPGCFQMALFQLEARLETDDGDVAAPENKNFDNVALDATGVDQLVFIVSDETTEMTLRTVNDEVLGTWTDIALPQP